jgi:hypothetical protein
MKENNVSCSDGLAEIDIGMNGFTIGPQAVSIEKFLKPNRKLGEFVEKAKQLELKHTTKADEKDKTPQKIKDPAQYIKELEALKDQYATTIKQSDENQEQYDKMLDRVFKVDLIKIKKNVLKFDGAGGAEIVRGLAPMLE